MSTTHTAKIGEIVMSKSPDVLQALALGSCVGVVIYDQSTKIGALAHILLPEITGTSNSLPGKFATTAIPEAIKMTVARGAQRSNLIAKIAGGARMFDVSNLSIMDVGQRNIEAVLRLLTENNIPVVAKDVGENFGRTIIFNLESGLLTIKQVMNKKTYNI